MFQLELEKELNAPVHEVYAFWTQPELMQRWFAPGEMTVPAADAEAVEGGIYSITMQNSQDEGLHKVSGQYRKVEANKRLIFTWQWLDSPNISLVEVNFTALSETRTKIQIVHKEFVEEDARDKHQEGWNGCITNLEKALTG